MRVTSVSVKNCKSLVLKRLFHYIPTGIVALVIAYLSLVREPGIPMPLFSGWDKLAHFMMYGGLSAVMLLDVRRDGRLTRRMSVAVFAVCSLYGGVIEILQENFFYPRTGDWPDWLADCLGAAGGICVMLLLWKHLKKDAAC